MLVLPTAEKSETEKPVDGWTPLATLDAQKGVSLYRVVVTVWQM